MRLVDADKIKEEVALMWGDNSHITESICEIIDHIPTENPLDKEADNDSLWRSNR